MSRVLSFPNGNCGVTHVPVSASDDAKLAIMVAELEEKLRGEFVQIVDLKTINGESLLKHNCDCPAPTDLYIKSVTSIKEMQTGYVLTFNDGESVLLDTPTIEISTDNTWILDGVNTKIPVTGPQGVQGVSILSVKKTATDDLVDTYTIAYSDGTESYFTVVNGRDGTSTKVVTEPTTAGTLVAITDYAGEHTFEVLNGVDGTDGKDGVSPSVEISTIQDESGEDIGTNVTFIAEGHSPITFDLMNGVDGKDGKDGITPIITTNELDDGAVVVITVGTDTQSIELKNGKDGAPGTDGTDGISPEISTEAINDGTRVTITSAAGETSFDVLNGAEQDLTGYATEDWVTDQNFAKQSDLPSVANFVTTERFETAVAAKADNIPFTSDVLVGNTLGKFEVQNKTLVIETPTSGFTAGDSLNGLTLATILAKLVGSDVIPDEPADVEEIVETVIENQYPAYTQDATGALVQQPYTYDSWTASQAKEPMDGITTFYQIVDDSGTVIESGYQCATVENDVDWLTVSLPDVISSFIVEQYNDDINNWQEVTFKMTGTPDSTIPGYTCWRADDLYEVVAGATYRFIITG